MKKSCILLLCCILSACDGGNKAGNAQTGLSQASLVEFLKSNGCSDSDIKALKSGQPISDSCRVKEEQGRQFQKNNLEEYGCKETDAPDSANCKQARIAVEEAFAKFFDCGDKPINECSNFHFGLNRLDGKEPV